MMTPNEVLDFWFAGDPTAMRPIWFEKSDDFDAACGRFAEVLRAAKRGAFDEWAETPRGALALLIVLDQFSRNLHRDSSDAYAADAQARAVARAAITKGFDRQVGSIERMFFYLPFEHSEEMADQDESVRLFETLRNALGDETMEYVLSHHDVIRRFGRFPHRNGLLGRASTPEELAYLAESGARFR